MVPLKNAEGILKAFRLLLQKKSNASLIMVGDTDSDILFGKNLGMKTIRIKTHEEINIEADLTVESLYNLKVIWEKGI